MKTVVAIVAFCAGLALCSAAFARPAHGEECWWDPVNKVRVCKPSAAEREEWRERHRHHEEWHERHWQPWGPYPYYRER